MNPKTVTHKNDIPFFGEEELLKIAPNKNFAAMIYELLSGKAPSASEAKIFELILNISIDHGPDAPSAVATIGAKKEGKTLPEAISAGIGQINDAHGGAGEPAMELLYKVTGDRLQITSVVDEYLGEGKRIPGFGHRIYEIDPRAELILETSKKNKIGEEFIDIARQIETELKNKKGRPIPVNIDGAIACVLCGLGWDPSLGKAVFVIARTPGLVGQYLNAKRN